MKKLLNKLLPDKADGNYQGYNHVRTVFVVIAVVSMLRSCIHLILPDGGAGTIAGLNLVSGHENIIFTFGLWGLSQLIYAFIQLLVAFKYKSLIPLFCLILVFEILGRMYIGYIKSPDLLGGMPPGAIGNYILLPLGLVMLFFSLVDKNYE